MDENNKNTGKQEGEITIDDVLSTEERTLPNGQCHQLKQEAEGPSKN